MTGFFGNTNARVWMLLLLFTRGLKVGRAKPCKASQRPSVRLADPHPAAASKSKRDTKLACLQNKQPKSAPARRAGVSGVPGPWDHWGLWGPWVPRVPTFPGVPAHVCIRRLAKAPECAHPCQHTAGSGTLGTLGTLGRTLGTLATRQTLPPRNSGTQRPRDFKRSLVAPRILGLEGILARTSRRVPLSLGILQHHRVMQKHKMPKPRHTHTRTHCKWATTPQHHLPTTNTDVENTM